MKIKSSVIRVMQHTGSIDKIMEFMKCKDRYPAYEDYGEGHYAIYQESENLFIFTGDYLAQLSDGNYGVIDCEYFDKWYQEILAVKDGEDIKIQSLITRAIRSTGNIQEIIDFIGEEDIEYQDLEEGDYLIDSEDGLLVFVGDILVQLKDGSYNAIGERHFKRWYEEIPE